MRIVTGNVIFAESHAGLAISYDGGATWECPTADCTLVHVAANVVLTDDGAFFVAGPYAGESASPCGYCGEVYSDRDAVAMADGELVCAACALTEEP